MTKKGIPSKYLVDGLKAVGYSKPDSSSEAVDFKTPNGIVFVLAKDMMGIQFCNAGRLWPIGQTFRTMKDAIAHIKKHTDEAIAFFEADKPAESEKPFNVVDVLFAAACAGQGQLPK